MLKTAWLFPGQGSQAAGMGRELCAQFKEARAVFEEADEALGERLSVLCFEGPQARLRLTANAQPAILAASVAALEVLARRAERPAFVAGHSVGEYSALVAAGAMRLGDAVRVVRSRGSFMQQAVPEKEGAMAAAMGLAPALVEAACERAAQGEIVVPASYNAPEQTVISGHAGAVRRAMALLEQKGARVTLLPVSAPFHSALMEPVGPRLRELLSRVPFAAPVPPVVTNVEARPNADAARILPLLVEQVTAPVRWMDGVRELERQGVGRVVELGPGRVLCGLVRRTSRAMACFNVEDPASLGKALAGLGA